MKNDYQPQSLVLCTKPAVSDRSVMASPLKIDLSSLGILLQETSQPNLQIENVSIVSIPPRKIYHPTNINASFALICKHWSRAV